MTESDNPSPSRARRDKLVALGSLIVLATWLAYLNRAAQADDAMICLRYVRNLVDGLGWSFNPGEATQGSTSVLNTLLLALATWVSGEPIPAQVVVQGLCVAGAAWFVLLLVERDHGFLAGALAAAIVVSVPLFETTQGLECAPFACGLTAATWAAARGRLRLASLLVGLTALARPSGILLVPILFGHEWWRARSEGRLRQALSATLVPVGIVLGLWSAWAWAAFGSPLPNTLAAKIAQRDSGLFGHGHLFWRGLRGLLPQVVRRGINLNDKLVLAVFLLGLVVSVRTRLWPLLVFATVQTLAYVVLNPPFYHWYALPMFLGVALGVVAVFLALRSKWPRAALIVPIGWLALSAPDLVHERAPYPNTLAYQNAAAALAKVSAPGQTFAAWEIGNLGYHLRELRVLDLAGLVTEAAHEPLSRGDTTWFLARKPDFVLLHDPPWKRMEEPIVEHATFRTHYRLIETIAAPPPYGVRIYERQ